MFPDRSLILCLGMLFWHLLYISDQATKEMDNAGDIVWEYMKEILLQVLGMAPVQLEFPVPDCELGACFNGAPSCVRKICYVAIVHKFSFCRDV